MNHLKVNAKSKIIKTWKVTSAEVHDSHVLEELLKKSDEQQSLWGDSAYRSEEIEQELSRRSIRSRIHEKGRSNHPLTKRQQLRNHSKSWTRARVEHVFCFMENAMKVRRLRAIGKQRIEEIVGLINLAYNICRYVQLVG